jgi:hypothetical protein
MQSARLIELLPPECARDARRTRFSLKLIARSLQDLEGLYEFEDELRPIDGEQAAADVNALRSIWSLFQEWLEGAERLAARIGPDPSLGTQLGALRVAMARARARLSITPEQIATSMANVAAGRVIQGEDVRDELRARMGA